MPSAYRGELAAKSESYKHLAREEAAQFRPPTDAKTLDRNEAAIVSLASKHLSDERELVDDELRTVSQRIASLRQRLVHWQAQCDEVLLEKSLRPGVEAELIEARDRHIQLLEKRKRAEVELRMFRVRNDIDGEARYPVSLWDHLGIVVIFLVVETIFNAAFYKNDEGLIGGAAMAFIVALVNLGLAATLGIGFRYKNLKHAGWRAFGWSCLALAIAIGLYLNALFAAFRAEYVQIDSADSAQFRAAFARALESAADIFVGRVPGTDFTSFLLFGFGILLSGVAFWKGYTAFDRNPGHQPLHEELGASKKDEQEAMDQAIARLKAFLKKKRDRVQSLLSEPSSLSSESSVVETLLGESSNAFDVRSAHVVRDAGAVLTAYRHENATIRSTESPKYFEALPVLSISGPLDEVTRCRTDIDSINSALNAARTVRTPVLQEHLNSIIAQSNEALTEGVGRYQQSAEREADDRINRTLQVVERVR